MVCAAAPASAQRGSESRIEVRDQWLYVDGEAFLVKGVGYSPARPGQLPWTTPVSLEVMAKDFAKIREAGFNTLRTWAPLTPEQLALAKQYGLMVLQGIWVDQRGNYLSEAFQKTTLDTVRREVKRAAQSDNVLAVLVGNELLPERVYLAGLSQTNALLRLAYQTAKDADPQRPVSYANWPQLPALDLSFWDLIGLNLYPYEPASVSHSLTFRGYLEYLKRTAAGRKPLIVTEVGLSVSPMARRSGYGGHTEEEQAREVVKLWDAVFQAGAQGACVFEWNDEWWKQAESTGDEQTHDTQDPEEWFGIMRFQSAEQTEPEPRPLYDALKTYNHAILLSPAGEDVYQDRVPVAVYTTDAVRSIRVRVAGGKWRAVTQVSPHWWKTQLTLPSARSPKSLRVTMEARDGQGQALVKQERLIWVGLHEPAATLTISTDLDQYEVDGDGLVSMQAVIAVKDTAGQPLADRAVRYSVAEPQEHTEQTFSAQTDAQGIVQATYLLREPGFVSIAAGTPLDRYRPSRRVGAVRSVVVERRPAAPVPAALTHQPSAWERKVSTVIQDALSHATPAFQLADPGSEPVVDYARYGQFHGIGTPQYRYEILDRDGLAAAVGEGIYPNEQSLLRDPAYRAALEADQLTGSVWDFTYHPNVALGFFKWADSSQESPGVKQFFTAMALERAGLLQQAVKAYDAVLVHFPETVGWTEFQTPWYVGVVARDKLEALLRLHPELGLRLEGAKIVVEHGFDNDVDNDVVSASPGQLVRVQPEAVNPPSQDLSQVPVSRELGKGRVRLRQYANRHWQLLVDGKVWVIRGMSYQPSAVGESPDEGTLKDWMTADRNQNGKPDGPFDTFVDANANNRQDPEEPTVGDFQLLKELGVNTLRLYHHASNKALLRQLYEQDGIMVLMGDLVGMYTVGSGAKWEEGTNYLDPQQRKRMTQSVRQMVREFKDEPYILMWVLGNENNYGGVHGIIGGRGNAAQYPKEFYAFLNELAEWIHKEDPHHPVAIANGEWLYVDLIAQQAPAIDVFGANVYRGAHGFGRSFFEAVQQWLDKPVLITEFGCPAYQANKPPEISERDQMLYHFGSWVDLEDHLAGRGVGNALGGVVFAWTDEWWKAGQPPRFSPSVQETTPNWSGPFPDGKNYEEWFGIASQGDGRVSPYLRQLRRAYRLYEQLWK
ncbi:MAG: hypothetical protein HY596_04590 [Candidatus Omnitrophica bacterium]|nr:hypothetical protein [Candidatus Omnitrophota bacterium]